MHVTMIFNIDLPSNSKLQRKLFFRIKNLNNINQILKYAGLNHF
jgi:hypothetical protein